MDIKSKIDRVKELKSEAKSLQYEIAQFYEKGIPQLFFDKGFIKDPKWGGKYLNRSFYDPKTRISVWFTVVGSANVMFSVNIRTEDGIDWEGRQLPGYTKWSYVTTDFDKFFNTVLQKRIKNVTEYSEGNAVMN